MKKVGIIVAISLVLLVGVMSIFLPSRSDSTAVTETEQNEAVSVSTALVRVGTVERTLSFHGSLSARSQVHVIPKVPGRVGAVHVLVGDDVEEGDILIQLETEELELQKRQALASLAMAQANLARVEAGAREEEVEQAEANLDQARASLVNAELTYESGKRLHEQGVMSGREWDGIQAQYDVARAQFRAAEKTVELVRQGARDEDVASARASVAQAQAAADLAALSFGNASVRSPIDGRVSQVSVERGGMAGGGSPVVTVVDVATVQLNVQVSERDVVHVLPRQEVRTTLNAFPGHAFYGEVRTVAPAADPAGGLFPLTIEIPNEQGLLRPGMYGMAEIVIDMLEDVPIVPARAVFAANDRSYVYVVRDRTAYQVEVEIGLRDSDQVAVTAGLVRDDEVVVSGQDRLRPYDPVHVAERRTIH